MDEKDPQHNTQGVPDENAEADTASGGAPEEPTADVPETPATGDAS